MNGTAHADLLRQLKHMQQHGGHMPMLVMTGQLRATNGQVLKIDDLWLAKSGAME
jgi:hypothetical protein